MGIKANYRPAKQCWLKISSSGLTVFETGTHSDGLPYVSIKARQQAEAPLDHPAKHAAWVKKHATASQINLLLSEDLYQLLLSDVPDVPDEELESAIELKAADLISYDIENAIMDVIQLPSAAYRGRMKMAFIVATQKSAVQQWLIELIQLGTKVKTVDVLVTQLRNFGLRVQNFTESGIFQIMPNRSRLLLSYDDEMVLSRTFDTGLKDLVSTTRTVQEDELELTVDDDAQASIQLESLTLDVRRSFDYYESQLGLGAVAEMNILCGSDHRQMAENIARKMGIRFNLIDPTDYLHIFAEDEVHGSGTYYELIGTAFREAY